MGEYSGQTDLETVRIAQTVPIAAIESRRIAVFASGRGSDFQSLLDSNTKGETNLDIALLVCNNREAFVIERARNHGIPYVIIDHSGKEREEFDREVDSVLKDNDIGLIVLAGFMRILSPWFVKEWKGRIVNIHPALLPSFPGAHAHRDALEHGVKVTGLTIHFVDEKVDHGPIIFQYPVEVKDYDTEETLSKRVLDQEHIWYPRVVQWIVDGRVNIEGRRVLINRPDRRP
ncbi:MAG: phosphoribosylglycinamide formyltransferase [Thermoplasmatota archaeon]